MTVSAVAPPSPPSLLSRPDAQEVIDWLNLRLWAEEKKLKEFEETGLPPSGAAGGVLKGTYPNPSFAIERATLAELEAEITARKSGDTTNKTAIETEKAERKLAEEEFVKGPVSATTENVATFNGTTGKIVKDGGRTIAEQLARANHTGTQLASTVSDFDTQVRTSRLDQMTAPSVDLSINSHKLTKVSTPTEGTDAANKSYVDSAASAAAAGLSVKNPVSYASTAAITVSVATEKTLEGTVPMSIDGTGAFAAGTRVLLKTQATGAQNGIYEVTTDEVFGGIGSKFGSEGMSKFMEGNKWLLTRTSDADQESEVVQGMYVPVTLGTTNAGTAWTLTTANPIVIGTTTQTFGPFTAQPGGSAGGDLEGTYPNPQIKTGTIVNTDVNSAAAIAYSKLNLATSVVNADIATAAEIAYSKLKLATSIASGDLATGAKELFPQLQTAGAHKEAFGSKTVTWPGGSNFTAVVEVEHGLGSTPAAISFAITGTEIGAFLPPSVYLSANPTSTLLKIQAWANGLVTAGKTAIVYWRAIT